MQVRAADATVGDLDDGLVRGGNNEGYVLDAKVTGGVRHNRG